MKISKKTSKTQIQAAAPKRWKAVDSPREVSKWEVAKTCKKGFLKTKIKSCGVGVVQRGSKNL